MKAPKSIISTSIIGLLWAVASASALTMETVTIGNPGNPHDQLTGGFYGGVSYTYNIGKYEVTLNQYTEFLNAVARTDAYGAYNGSVMGADLIVKGITRSGSSGSYAYAVSGDGQRPVAGVNWFNAARFTNWLHNGQPTTGTQTAATTETGAYLLNGATSGLGFNNRSGGAQYWLPSENEWYKAAYYQPAAQGGDTDGYWLYPTRSNSIPNSRNGSGSDSNSGNFYRDDSLGNGYNDGYAVTNSTSFPTSNALTAVGSFTQASSYYGTFDQGGNIYEWTDTNIPGSSLVFRGGSWAHDEGTLQAFGRQHGDPTNLGDIFGFRIATVIPEPSAWVSLAIGAASLLALRRRRRCAGV